MKTSLFFSPDRDITNAYKNFGAIGSVMRKVRGMSAPANCYRRARDGDTDAMIGWLKKRRNLPEALSQAEQNERFKGYEVPSTSMELEMICLKDPQALPENAHSPVSEDAP